VPQLSGLRGLSEMATGWARLALERVRTRFKQDTF
jgi:hypothetical protein